MWQCSLTTNRFPWGTGGILPLAHLPGHLASPYSELLGEVDPLLRVLPSHPFFCRASQRAPGGASPIGLLHRWEVGSPRAPAKGWAPELQLETPFGGCEVCVKLLPGWLGPGSTEHKLLSLP